MLCEVTSVTTTCMHSNSSPYGPLWLIPALNACHATALSLTLIFQENKFEIGMVIAWHLKPNCVVNVVGSHVGQMVS